MGSIALLAMAEEVEQPGYVQQKSVHPFFASNRPAMASHMLSRNNTPKLNNGSCNIIPDDDVGGSSGEEATRSTSDDGRKRRKLEVDIPGDKEQGGQRRSRKRYRTSPRHSIAKHFVRLSKTGDEEAVVDPGVLATQSVDHQEQGGLMEDGSDTVLLDVLQPNHVLEENEDPSHNLSTEEQNQEKLRSQSLSSELEIEPPKPRKILQFNPQTGTIGSPPKAKVRKAEDDKATGEGKRTSARGRPRKASSLVVKVAYGTSMESRIRIGTRIQAIFDESNAQGKPEPPSETDQRDIESYGKLEGGTKPMMANTHPLFLPKTKSSSTVVMEPPDDQPKAANQKTKQSSSMSCLPKRPNSHSLALKSIGMARFGGRNSGPSFPGSRLPAWPWKDTVHVQDDADISRKDAGGLMRIPHARKSKGHAVKIADPESVMKAVTKKMGLPAREEVLSDANGDEIRSPSRQLRLPQKHLESGRKLQDRVYCELKTRVTLPARQGKAKSQKKQKKRKDDKEDSKPTTTDDAPTDGAPTGLPPSLVRLFDSIRTNLSAFDRSGCETASWAQKYAPVTAAEVLQPGKEAFFLREWLQALMVQAVDTGSSDVDKARGGSSRAQSSSAAKKRKRRSRKLDDFIVPSDDDEVKELELDSDTEQDWSPSGMFGMTKPTVVRTKNALAEDAARLMNTVVISGPHGCGKTAVVYAAAKELEFEVFEINPSSRRSGKDVLEKIGDMTRNHLVKQHQHSSSQEDDGTTIATEECAVVEPKGGKQATMSSFFKLKPSATKSKKQPKQPKPTPESAEPQKERTKSQKQSLILLDEVDILYEEDKQFWSTVISLIAQSKRPFVMTCNDETLLPLQSLDLHGIFRFSPPPLDLAVDRLLLIAANEGHALKREAVEALYESRDHDLRAATMDLNYWCQIGVGDRRGGFDWFYLRWPKGIDRDENDEVVRVVSEGTYHLGMNWLGRDRLVDHEAWAGEVEQELLLQVWNSWELDLGDWQDSPAVTSWAENAQAVTTTPAGRLSALQAYEHLAESMSTADVCSSGTLVPSIEGPLDATLPEMSAKTREDFTIGLQLLDAPLVPFYDALTSTIPFAIKSLAKACLRENTYALQRHGTNELRPLDEPEAVRAIQARFTSPSPDTPAISRIDFALAFDGIAVDPALSAAATSHLDLSVFDRNLEPIVLDVAPYVRSIFAYEARLQQQRLKFGTLVSEGGRGGRGAKRMRTTRAALSALEGGSRSSTRRERWFKADINACLVMRTGGNAWGDFALAESNVSHSSTSSTRSTQLHSRAGFDDDSPDDLA